MTNYQPPQPPHVTINQRGSCLPIFLILIAIPVILVVLFIVVAQLT